MFTILKLLAILLLLYFLIRKKIELGIVLIACTIITAILFRLPVGEFSIAVYRASTDHTTISLLIMVYFILVLSHAMRDAGALEELVGAVRRVLVDNRFTIGFLPSLIGLLPMPGGALFSAPMIEKLADEADLSPEFRTYLNYWFRHVWEYTYPLYPGLLLAVAILEVDLAEFTFFQMPLSLAAILGGSVFGLLKIKKLFHKPLNGVETGPELRKFIHGFWPVLLVTVTVIIIPLVLKRLGVITLKSVEPVDMMLIILPVTILMFGLPRLGRKRFSACVRKAFNFKLLGMLLSVLIFKEVIQASGAVEELPVILEDWHVPREVLFIVLPMIVGYLTGITHSYVSVAFPLLIPFFGDPVDLRSVQLAYAFGFIGVLFSPVHLCLILSSEYFKADMQRVIRLLWAPCAVIGAVSVLIYVT